MTLTPQQFKAVLDSFLGLHGTDEGGNEPNSAAAYHSLRSLCGAAVADIPCLPLLAERPCLHPYQEDATDQLASVFRQLAIRLQTAANRSYRQRAQSSALKEVQQCQSSTKPSVTS